MTLLEAAKEISKQLEGEPKHPALEVAYQELRKAIAAEPVPEPAPAPLQETGDPWKDPLPSAEDLDAVADESKVRDITSKPKKAWGK